MAHEDGPLPFEVRMRFPVQTYDIDFAGVVSNIVYIRWLEDLRLKVLENYYPLQLLLGSNLAPTLVETRIRYQLPIRINDEVEGLIWVNEMRRMKFFFTAEFSVNGALAANAQQTGCVVDLRSGKPAPLPDGMLATYRAEER